MTEAEVIDRINSTIKKNGKNAITGDEMNFVLKAIIQLIADAGATVNWGDIEGTIADQLDLASALNNKVDVVSGKGLSTNDFTNTLKSKLDGIEAGAEVNVKADWTATSGDAEILNKPTIPDASDFVAKSDYTPAHSILAQQSGTGSPTAVSIGNNEILGRKSGGGSDIQGLSASEVKTILNYTSSEILTALGWWKIHETTAGSNSSGISNTISKSIELPDFGSILKIEKITAIKTGTNAVFRIRVYLSEIDNNIDVAGGTAILLAIAATSNANNIYLPMERIIENIGGNLRTIANNANQFSDMIQSGSRLDVAKLTGSPLYLIIAVQCDSASDSARFESAYITNH
jgi:hypothetical protein